MSIPFSDGYRRFRNTTAHALAAHFRAIANGCPCQCLFVTCVDGRVDPALIFDLDPGACMIVRTVGAIVTPPGPDTKSLNSAIALAVQQDGARDVVVLGHSNCRAAQWHTDDAPDPALAAMLREAQRGRENAPACEVEKALVASSVRHLSAYDGLAGAPVRIHGLWFDIGPATLSTVVTSSGK